MADDLIGYLAMPAHDGPTPAWKRASNFVATIVAGLAVLTTIVAVVGVVVAWQFADDGDLHDRSVACEQRADC